MNTHGQFLCGHMFSFPLCIYLRVESTFFSKKKKSPKSKRIVWSGFKISFVAMTEQVNFMTVGATAVPGTY